MGEMTSDTTPYCKLSALFVDNGLGYPIGSGPDTLRDPMLRERVLSDDFGLRGKSLEFWKQEENLYEDGE
jgi:hypothetical protein